MYKNGSLILYVCSVFRLALFKPIFPPPTPCTPLRTDTLVANRSVGGTDVVQAWARNGIVAERRHWAKAGEDIRPTLANRDGADPQPRGGDGMSQDKVRNTSVEEEPVRFR